MKNSKIEIKKAYHLMVKMAGLKKFSGLGGQCLQSKIIHYSIYEISTQADLVKFETLIQELREDNTGSEFVPRIVNGWSVK